VRPGARNHEDVHPIASFFLLVCMPAHAPVQTIAAVCVRAHVMALAS
jgi:hypothetical protein